jgi:hypothetical protein
MIFPLWVVLAIPLLHDNGNDVVNIDELIYGSSSFTLM